MREPTIAEPGARRWLCEPCGLVYVPDKGDPDGGVPPGRPFEHVPDDWACPTCGAGKAAFREITLSEGRYL
jgi:rubredoxin